MRSTIFITGIVLLLLVAGAQAQYSIATDPGVTSSDISVALTSQNPNPVDPGEIVDIEIEIQNNGLSDANKQIVEFIEKEPFTLVIGEDKTKSFNSIAATGSIKVSYKVKVSSDAATNTYDLELRIYNEDRPDIYIKRTVPINIQGSPKLVIEDVELNPTVLEPSGSGELIITLKNAGTGTARQVEAELQTNETVMVPILSGGLQYVDELVHDDSTILRFNIGIDSEADYRTYASTLAVMYKDEAGELETKTFSIGIPITGTILLDVIKVEPSYERGILRIEIANKGTTVAKSVEAKLLVDGEVVDIDYISQIKPNKQTTFDFPLRTSGTGKLVLNFIGPGLEQNSIEKDVMLTFSLPNGGADGTTTVITVVIVIIILYFLARKFIFKKKKK